ncbi:MAG: hypothetical protein HGA45_01280 [Chloroflexales bacterium]|nr:hypothetical protein [Chloroflexales bacterium]
MTDERQSESPFAFPPAGALIAIFDREPFLQEALPDLQRLAVAAIYQMGGQELRGRGAGARVQRAIGKGQAELDEARERQRSIDQLIDAARDDQLILVVHLATPDQAAPVRAALMRHHAHTVRHFERGAE